MRFVCDSCRAQYMISDEKVGPKGVKVRCKKCGYVILVKKADASGAKAAAAQAPAHEPTAPVPLSNDPDDALATQVMQNPLTGAPPPPPVTGENEMTNPGGMGILSEEATAQMPAHGAGGLLGASEDEIGAVFDQVLNSGAHSLPKEKANDDDPSKTQADGVALGDGEDRMSTRVLDASVVQKLAQESGGEGGSTSRNGNGAGKEVPKTDWFVAIDDKQSGPLTLDNLKEHWERGEIGPDSLCWRAGFSDWIPLSEVEALASELAPRPSRPVIVSGPNVMGSMPAGAVVSVPVESAFSAGGVMKSVRSEVQVPLAAAGPEETGSWRPSAASALASLVKEEMEALAKPPSPSKPPVPEPLGVGENAPGMARGLLDLPPPEPVPERTNGKSNGANGHGPALGGAPGEATRQFGPQNPYLSNQGATYSSPAVSQYRPQQDNTKLIAIIAAAVVFIVLIGAVTVVFLNKSPPAPVAQPPVATATPTPAPAPPTPAPVAPPSATGQQPTPPAPNGATAAPTPQPPAPTAPAATPRSETPKASGTPRAVSAKSEKSEKSTTVAAKEPAPREEKEKEPAPKKVSVSGGDDEFAAAFGGEPKKGGGNKQAAEAPPEEKKKREVYIPPAPGSGGDVRESLGNADILEIVKSNLPALQGCVQKQHEKEPGTSGKLVMKWTILTSGKTAKIEVVSDEFKSTYLATCVTSLIKGWTFPRTKSQGDPVVFPFKF